MKQKDTRRLDVDAISNLKTYWNVPASQILETLHSSPSGLSESEATRRSELYGPNVLKPRKKKSVFAMLLIQFKSPLILLLLFSAVLSAFLGDYVEAIMIFVITFLSSFLGFWQERQASDAVAKLILKIQTRVKVSRDGDIHEIPVESVVPGDIVQLSAGKGVPGDCILIESKDLFVNEATLTGETFPQYKQPGIVAPDAPIAKRENILFMGTNVVSGDGKVVVVRTAGQTEFGKIYDKLKLRPAETDFERGIRRFGNFLVQLTFILVSIIFVVNVFFDENPFQIFLFALALAVGLTPDLLPAIVTITLSRGAKKMAEAKVIIKRLNSIENFGSMNVLCSDKTGTLTEGVVKVQSALDIEGHEAEQVLFYAFLNAKFQAGYDNAIDNAIIEYRSFDIGDFKKIDEIPYDFLRKRLTVLVSGKGKTMMISKGALSNILDACTTSEVHGKDIIEIDKVRKKLMQEYKKLGNEGFRILGVAYRNLDGATSIENDDEKDMTFLGFLVLHDPVKKGIDETIKRLKKIGVNLKMITGDNKYVALNVAKQLGLEHPRILSGQEIREMIDEALLAQVSQVDIFAEMEPNQKERIIIALKKAGNVVGYMGDGINDASALHAADVGISVDSAVDVAKDAADIVLLEKNLEVLHDGIVEGRKTFNNTLKYIYITQSANFGNMVTMAWTSLILPFLPMLPTQILLTNVISDIPAINIATDNVDPEALQKPGRWDIRSIKNFMIFFGLISSVFDTVTFFALLSIPGLSVKTFRTTWFIESMLTELFILLVLRSKKSILKSRASRSLVISVLIVTIATVLLPYTPVGELFSFTFLPLWLFLLVWLIVGGYIATSELGKKIFYREKKPTQRTR
nr:magnesium-translocating P-type ATPase [Candidatus Sigynarchaeota archaeon]